MKSFVIPSISESFYGLEYKIAYIKNIGNFLSNKQAWL